MKQPGRRYVKESEGVEVMKCKMRKTKRFGRRWEAEDMRLILQLVPFFMCLLDDGQFWVWIRNRKSAVGWISRAVQHERPLLYESRLRRLRIEADL